MKKLSLLLALLPMLFCGCSSYEEYNDVPSMPFLTDLTAGFADDDATRTYVENGKSLRWHEADLITAFFGNTLNRQYKFKGKTGDNSGTFSLVPSGELGTGNELDAIYALYPYDANATISDEGVISLSLPATQLYAENSFGKGANTMVAVTESVEDTFLPFKNTCGYLKLKLYGDATLASIEIKGNNEEKIAGAATATIEFGGVPSLTMGEDATTSVLLDCGEGVTLGTTEDTATVFWIVLPETTFEGGITITATSTEGGVFEKSTTNEVIIERNTIQPMAAVEAECEAAKPANNEIWYTNGSITEATTPYATDVFGANIVSNAYDAQKECWVITFDADVTSIGDYAFRSCNSLTSVTIPDSVTSIGNYAFEYCSSLKSITIPDSVTSIVSYVFSGCSSLTSITIPDSVTSIGKDAFSYCSSLTSITIPDSVTSIGSSAFAHCSSLTSITIGDSVTSIGAEAFCKCSSLASINIPESVKELGDMLFDNCNNIVEFSGKYAADNGRCLVKDGELIKAATKGLTYYAIPSCVKTLAHRAFAHDNNLKHIHITSNVLEIGPDCFYKSVIEYATFDEGLKYISSTAFQDCHNITSIRLPDSIEEILDMTFYYCTNLTSVTLGRGISRIPNMMFYQCNKLTDIVIPDNVIDVGNNAFAYCPSLPVKDNVRYADTYAIEAIDKTRMIYTLKEDTRFIGDSAFEECYNMYEITIPEGVVMIGYDAFYKCSNLKYVYCKPTTPPRYHTTWDGWRAFDYNGYPRYIYVPADSEDLYKDEWYEYKNYIQWYYF